MAFVNQARREITFKIVYYGAGLSGKTTNLHYLHGTANPKSRGKMFSLKTDTERTLFFDYLPMQFGKIRDFQIRFQLYTVPGQIFYNSSRKVVLKGVDGVVFVADSDPSRFESNIESLYNLEQNLSEHGYALKQLPHVMQYNKRDLFEVVELGYLNAQLNRYGASYTQASAITGAGVPETLKKVTLQIVKEFRI